MTRSERPLSGQVAIVTGAATGVGQACAAKLAPFGAHVACGDVKPAEPTSSSTPSHLASPSAPSLST